MQPKTIIKFLNKLKAWQQPEVFEKFLLACKADSRGRTGHEQAEFPQAKVLTEIADAAREVRLSEEEREGLKGEYIGHALSTKRAKVVNPIREKYAVALAVAK